MKALMRSAKLSLTHPENIFRTENICPENLISLSLCQFASYKKQTPKMEMDVQDIYWRKLLLSKKRSRSKSKQEKPLDLDA